MNFWTGAQSVRKQWILWCWCLQGSEVTERDGSNIRAPYTSHTDAEDVLYSGQICPDRRVSPEDANNHRKECSRSRSSQKITIQKNMWWTLKEKEKSEALTRASSSDFHRVQNFITCQTNSKVALSWATTTLCSVLSEELAGDNN